MALKYFTPEFMEKIADFTAPLSREELDTYMKEGEGSAQIRDREGLGAVRYLELVETIGTYLRDTSGENFTSDWREFSISEGIRLFSFELPGGGNLYLFVTPEGKMVLDTGYGYYYKDCEKMISALGLLDFSDVKVVVCTHGDADHCGASGYFPVAPVMHPVTRALLDSGTRNYHSENSLELLEKAYTTAINTFSRMYVPDTVRLCRTKEIAKRGLFSVIDTLDFAGMHFEIWESLGGHIAGQIFLYEEKLGLLFTSDALFNFASLSKARADYCSVADSMIGSVNVNSDIARIERRELTRLALEMEAALNKDGRRLLIACGHGAVSRINPDGRLEAAGTVHQYRAKDN
ncbi:MAG TPA: MBL fold metallo-hydrolase [Methanocorpusculum sp.]|nr:MBL fold metallo-hydrolase [Methanocorpusculum sp.]